MSVRVQSVWPIYSYTPGGDIKPQALEDEVGPYDDEQSVLTNLTAYVNEQMPEKIADVKHGEFNAVVRIERPSIEGLVPYDYLAVI